MATPAMRQYGNLKTHRSHFQQVRTALEALAERYGIGLDTRHAEKFAANGLCMKVPLRQARHEAVVVPCRAELDEAGWADPCLIVPADWPIALLPPHKRLAVGGQVKSIADSRFLLPRCVLEAAWHRTQTWQGCLMPVLVTINGEQKYLVRANSWFFQCGEHCGQDIDTLSLSDPNERELAGEAYHWGDDMSHCTTVILARF
jgi:hypothetical protein